MQQNTITVLCKKTTTKWFWFYDKAQIQLNSHTMHIDTTTSKSNFLFLQSNDTADLVQASTARQCWFCQDSWILQRCQTHVLDRIKGWKLKVHSGYFTAVLHEASSEAVSSLQIHTCNINTMLIFVNMSASAVVQSQCIGAQTNSHRNLYPP